MKGRTSEAIAGYVFASPIIITILIFTIMPIFTAVYYSFTNYTPLEAQKFNITFKPQESMEFHFNILYGLDELDYEYMIENFDALLFVELDIGVNLDVAQKQAVVNHLDKEKIIKDFIDGNLGQTMKISEFMQKYMRSQANLFVRYVPEFVGINNFSQMFSDQYFWIALGNAFYFSIIVVPIQTLIAVLLAVIANTKIRGQKFFKAVFFLPSITSSAAISMIFMLIYTKPGVLNQMLGLIGIQPVDWLNNPSTALPAVMVMNIWTTAGYFMVTFLAALQNIPSSVYEAADIDGASFGVRFWKITLPLLKPQVLFVSIMGIIGCMQVFDQIYFLIKNIRNMTISYYIYQNAFTYGKMGYASAIAWVLFAIIFTITTLQKKFIKEEAYF